MLLLKDQEPVKKLATLGHTDIVWYSFCVRITEPVWNGPGKEERLSPSNCC